MNKSATDNFMNYSGAASLEEEIAIGNLMSSLKKEIRELHFGLEDEKEISDKCNKTWKLDRKADKLDETIEKYEITLQSELKTINDKYDLKENKIKVDIESKLKKAREQEDIEIERIRLFFSAKYKKLQELQEAELEKVALERKTGIDGKTREYDTYIMKREEERKSILKDKNVMLENIPDKVTSIRKRRLLKQKIDDYNRAIQRHNNFFSRKKNPDLLLKENYGLEFLNPAPVIVHKPMEEKKVEEKKVEVKVEEKKVTYKEEPKKEEKKVDLEYERFMRKHNAIFTDAFKKAWREDPDNEDKDVPWMDLPDHPELITEDLPQDIPRNEYIESIAQHPPVLQTTKQKKVPKMVKA
jgi:hypothetical protein